MPVSGWTGVDWRPAPQGTAFTATASLPTLTADIEGTVTLVAVAVLNGAAAEVDWEARTTEILALTLDSPG